MKKLLYMPQTAYVLNLVGNLSMKDAASNSRMYFNLTKSLRTTHLTDCDLLLDSLILRFPLLLDFEIAKETSSIRLAQNISE